MSGSGALVWGMVKRQPIALAVVFVALVLAVGVVVAGVWSVVAWATAGAGGDAAGRVACVLLGLVLGELRPRRRSTGEGGDGAGDVGS